VALVAVEANAMGFMIALPRVPPDTVGRRSGRVAARRRLEALRKKETKQTPDIESQPEIRYCVAEARVRERRSEVPGRWPPAATLIEAASNLRAKAKGSRRRSGPGWRVDVAGRYSTDQYRSGKD
jgi:hypothetical protein